ncbi:unnamed protein product [Moneuplotes crassus]|uniref:Uncharacterized protein n=1 Tax=Euplotes crassus TaxID=5936 RepID=A0AAD1XJV9_EUPCR|nr:unnamed protein product [Moneuplotes crassus]
MRATKCEYRERQLHEIDELFLDFKNSITECNKYVGLLKFPDLTPAENTIQLDTTVSEEKEQEGELINDWKYQPQKSKEYETPEEAPTMIQQIQMTIHLHHYPVIKEANKSKRGRPEVLKDTRIPALKNVMEEWEIELIKRLTRDQRSDAFFASVGRYIKKIPDLFLKYIGSKCQYKSRDMKVVLRSYLRCFISGFLPLFPLCKRDNCLKGFIDIFCDFCNLSFPDAKCQILLKELLKEGSISKEVYERKVVNCKERIKASKMSYRKLYDNNRCFQLICAKLSNHFFHLKGSNLKKIENVLDFFNTKAAIYNEE